MVQAPVIYFKSTSKCFEVHDLDRRSSFNIQWQVARTEFVRESWRPDRRICSYIDNRYKNDHAIASGNKKSRLSITCKGLVQQCVDVLHDQRQDTVVSIRAHNSHTDSWEKMSCASEKYAFHTFHLETEKKTQSRQGLIRENFIRPTS